MPRNTEIESITLEDACCRAILKLILTPLKTKHKKIKVNWPIGTAKFNRPSSTIYEDDESIDFTQAHISLNHKEHPSIILDFIDGNLRITTIHQPKFINSKIQLFTVEELPLANPEVHIEAVAYLTKSINEATQ